MLTEQDLRIVAFNNSVEKGLEKNLSDSRGYPEPEQQRSYGFIWTDN